MALSIDWFLINPPIYRKFHFQLYFKEPIPRQAKSIAINAGIDEGSNDDFAESDEVISNEIDETHNDPVLDVISAFFGHDIENGTNVNEKNEEISQANNEKPVEIVEVDNDISFHQTNNEQLRSGPRQNICKTWIKKISFFLSEFSFLVCI